MKPACRKDTLIWGAAMIAVLLFLALTYATMILWTGANPASENNKPAVSPATSGPVPLVTAPCPGHTPAGNITGTPEIAIDPVPDQAPGTIITFTGTTNLAAGEPLAPVISSAEFVPCSKGPSLPDSVNPCGDGFAGNVSVRQGNCSLNIWSWSVDTSQHGFQAGHEYILTVSGRDGQVHNKIIFNTSALMKN